MTKKLGLVLAALTLVAAGLWWVAGPRGASVTTLPGLSPAFAQTTGGELPEVPELVLGSPDAPVTLVEYASFTCPHCASFHASVFKPLTRDYIETGKVRFVYREVFFDRPGLWAAMVARCGGTERFFGIADMLYTQQNDWARTSDPAQMIDKMRRIGRTAGLTDDQLDVCLSDAGMAQAMVTNFETNSQTDNVTSTPTLFINGEKHSNMSYDNLRQIIDARIGN